MIVELPLFQHRELTRLQQRREELLKRVQKMPAYTPGRPMVLYKLQQVTAEVMKLELQIGRRH
jgi:hypothetical protein